jgi:hypothetical protein
VDALVADPERRAHLALRAAGGHQTADQVLVVGPGPIEGVLGVQHARTRCEGSFQRARVQRHVA